MKYEYVNEDTRADILKSTLTGIEQEHYANTLALVRAKAIGDEGQISQFEDTLAKLEKQYEALSGKFAPAPKAEDGSS